MYFSFHFCTCWYSIIAILPPKRINQKIMTVQLEAVRHLPQIDMFCFIHSSPPAALLLLSPDFLRAKFLSFRPYIVSEWVMSMAYCMHRKLVEKKKKKKWDVIQQHSLGFLHALFGKRQNSYISHYLKFEVPAIKGMYIWRLQKLYELHEQYKVISKSIVKINLWNCISPFSKLIPMVH